MIISISGFDGSGKSTISKSLVQALKKNGVKSKYVHGYEFSFSHNFLNKRTKHVSQKLKINHSSKNQKGLLLKLWPWILLIDFSLKVLYFKYFCKKTIYIFDRYLYDYFISCIYQSYKLPIKLFFKLLPSPNQAFWLCPTIHFSQSNRSTEHSRKYFEKMKLLYNKYMPTSVSKYKTGINKASQDVEILLGKILSNKK